jgi:hypothetical protein
MRNSTSAAVHLSHTAKSSLNVLGLPKIALLTPSTIHPNGDHMDSGDAMLNCTTERRVHAQNSISRRNGPTTISLHKIATPSPLPHVGPAWTSQICTDR